MEDKDNALTELEVIGENPVAVPQGIAAIALTMAIKYHDTNVVHDGLLYQQYKLEGKNLQPLTLDLVFETAIKMEAHLLGASERIASIVVEAIVLGIEDDEETSPAETPE